MSRVVTGTAVTAAAAAAAHLVPSVVSIDRSRLRGLSGQTARRHVALTFDDGPDPASTPQVLDALDELGVRATFFVLGTRLTEHREIGRRIVDAGHEVAVHGWTHRPHLLRTPAAIFADLRRCAASIETITGRRPRFWRPPHGIPTGAGLLAARRLALRPVLWTADGLDWRHDATPDSIRDRIVAKRGPGGVVLLHDSDALCAPNSWRRAIDALPGILAHCCEQGWTVGPLGEHGFADSPDAAA
jgi:peptidoglycan/xylan/chitin deacetylase (PgdA/CDA1 family)